MKRFFTSIIALMTFMTAQSQQLDGISGVVNAFKSGNASALSRFFDNTVDIDLPNKSNSYSKNQAELVLKEFFSIKGVKGFDVIHRGDNPGTQYCIGTLQTKSGNFRTTVYLRQKGEDMVIQELKFESN